MTEFAEEFVTNLDDIDGFILKSKSPSCGIKDVKVYYHGNKCSISNNGSGFFSQKIIDKYNYLPIENEGRLRNYNIRDNFFTKIFFINNLKSCDNIIDFHNKNLLLVKSYNKDLLGELDEILNKNILNDELLFNYKEKVLYTLSNGMNKNNKISIIKDLFERYKPMLNSEEVKMFNDLLDSYENQKIPFSTLGVAIRMYATRFNDIEILNQTFFSPYPENLINITDSGKGRKL